MTEQEQLDADEKAIEAIGATKVADELAALYQEVGATEGVYTEALETKILDTLHDAQELIRDLARKYGAPKE